MTLRIVQTVMGIALVLVGIVIVGVALAVIMLARSLTLWGIVLVGIGLAVAILGGILIPSSGVADGVTRFGTVATPLLRLIPGGRRATDPPIAAPAPAPAPSTVERAE